MRSITLRILFTGSPAGAYEAFVPPSTALFINTSDLNKQRRYAFRIP